MPHFHSRFKRRLFHRPALYTSPINLKGLCRVGLWDNRHDAFRLYSVERFSASFLRPPFVFRILYPLSSRIYSVFSSPLVRNRGGSNRGLQFVERLHTTRAEMFIPLAHVGVRQPRFLIQHLIYNLV